MGQAPPRTRDLARRLIAHELSENKSSETKNPAPFLVDQKLRALLVTLMGSVGFQALLSRALALTNAEGPWLRAVTLKADGSFERLDELGEDQIFEGGVVLLTHLLGLLVAFIGEDLTLRLVGEIWPELSPDLDKGSRT